jgi:hypothetical protein
MGILTINFWQDSFDGTGTAFTENPINQRYEICKITSLALRRQLVTRKTYTHDEWKNKETLLLFCFYYLWFVTYQVIPTSNFVSTIVFLIYILISYNCLSYIPVFGLVQLQLLIVYNVLHFHYFFLIKKERYKNSTRW